MSSAKGAYTDARQTWESIKDTKPRDPPPNLNTRKPLDELKRDVLRALAKANDPARGEPRVYARGGKLTRVHYDEDGRPTAEPLRHAGLAEEIARVVQFQKSLKNSVSAVYPPDAVVGAVLEAGEYKLPPLAGITEVPVMRPDGTILDTPGYDVATRLLYVVPNDDTPRWLPVPESPTDEQVRDAWKRLHYVFADFPFATPADRANLMALLATLVMRPAIPGHIPLAAIESPAGGTGKSLLAGVVARIGTGSAAEMLQEPDNPEEWRKRITSTLLAGRSFTCIDNVENVLDAQVLASMLTADVYVDRVLGLNKMARISGEQLGVWCATGNNLSFGGTMPRRCYRIRLDAKVANPYLRSTFQQPRLLEWVGENRMEILRSLLLVCRAWFARGRPSNGAPILGNFEQWAEMLWGVLSLDPTRVDPQGPDVTCFGARFLANGAELWAQGDGDAEEWEPMLRALDLTMSVQGAKMPVQGAKVGTSGGVFTAKEVANLVEGDKDVVSPRLKAALPGSLVSLLGTGKFTQALGMALKKHKDKRYGDEMWRVESAEPDPHWKVARWVVKHGN